MLKELTKNDWLSLLNISEEKIPSVLILRGTRNLKTQYEKHRAHFKNVVEVGSPNGIFEDVFIGNYNDIVVGYASVYGAMASEVVHVFGVLGTSLVIQTGSCGALADGIATGDIVCATSAHCGEGAAQYYLPDESEISASPELIELAAGVEVPPVTLHRGPIWTTAALFAEGKEEIQMWQSDGYIAVDMETATTFAVAKYFGMRHLSLLFVFDVPHRGDHILLTDDEKRDRRLNGEKALLDLVFFLLKNSAR